MPHAYAIDFASDASGKHFKSSKYRVLFRFGFSPNQHPVLEHEHVVTLSWSPVSGKAVLAADGQEVHMSDHFQSSKRRGLIGSSRMPHKKQSKFEYSWDLVSTDMEEQSHSLEIVACSQQQHRRQFDLIIDGVSYFDLPKYDEEEGRILGIDLKAAVTCTTVGSADTAETAEGNNVVAASSSGSKSIIEEVSRPTIISQSEEEGADSSWLDIDVRVNDAERMNNDGEVGNTEEEQLSGVLQ